MGTIVTAMLWSLAALGILLSVVIVLVLIVLLIPASVWLDYQKEILTVSVGALGIRIKIFPQKPLTPEKAAKKAEQKAKKDAQKAAEKERTATQKLAQQSRGADHLTGTSAKNVSGQKNTLLQMTFDQICLAVSGVGALGKAILNALRIEHIRLYLPVHAADAAETAIQYGKLQAWLHGGIAVLDRFLWMDFTECRLVPDFMGDQEKTAYFSCQISARFLIIVVAALKLLWLLWKHDILIPLLDQLAGNKK